MATKTNKKESILTQRIIKRGRVIAWLAAAKNENGNVYIGHSKYKKGDQYDTNLGKTIAINRAVKVSSAPIAKSTIKHLEKFAKRCRNYFKETPVVSPVLFERPTQ